jgi:antitoxin (DNA-binding transcriptional repressor) of toxin-antitoxin stability system
MADIGVRELKTKASQIVRNIRKHRARYVVTYRGHPVALLIPFDEPGVPGVRSGEAADDGAWEELTRLGQLIAQSWPVGVTSAEVLSEMRR